MKVGLVGTGWRADFFLRIAAALPPAIEIVGVSTRDLAKGELIGAHWGVQQVRTPAELVDSLRPDFVVASVAKEVMPEVIATVVARGVPVLAETPPAGSGESMRALWSVLDTPELVQVAEQHPSLPRFQACAAVIAAGTIGTVTSAQLSWTHGYHAVALLRALLGVGFAEVLVTATRFTAPAAVSLGRSGWPSEHAMAEVPQTIATLDFGDRLGLYDFTEGQWFHPLMSRRLVIRGTGGEIVNDAVTRLIDPQTPVRSEFVRRQTGIDGDLEGADLDTIALDGEVRYRNPFGGLRFSDEEIAMATVVTRMAAWVRGEGEPPYPLAEACQDQLIALAIEESAETSTPTRVGKDLWAAQK